MEKNNCYILNIYNIIVTEKTNKKSLHFWFYLPIPKVVPATDFEILFYSR